MHCVRDVCVGLRGGDIVSRADSLDWKKSQDRVDASIDDWNLGAVLEKIANVTGWQVYVEPGTKATISANLKISHRTRLCAGC